MNDEVKQAVEAKTIFVVYHGNHYPREVEALFATAESAQVYIENGRRSSVMCDLHVEEWEVGE